MKLNRTLFFTVAFLFIVTAFWPAATVTSAGLPQSANSIGFVTRFRLQSERLVLREKTLYSGYNHFAIADVSDVRNIKVLDEIFFTPYIYDIALDGQYAYTAQQSFGVRNLDILVNTISEFTPVRMPESALAVVASNGVLYVANGSRGIRVLDITKPADLPEIGAIKLPGYSNGLALAGSTLVVCSGYDGIRLVDVSNQAAPLELSALPLPGFANSVTIAGSLAYVADGFGGVRIIDISDPKQPVEIGAYTTPGSARRIVLRAPYAYVAASEGGVLILDISDPKKPALAARYVTDGAPVDLVLLDNYILVANMPNGIDVLSWVPPLHANANTAASQFNSPDDQVHYKFTDGTFRVPTTLSHQVLLPGSAAEGGGLLAKAGAFFTISASDENGALVKALKPFQIQLPYRENGVDPRMIQALGVYGWTGTTWVKVPSTVDGAQNLITATTDWFTTYGLFLDRSQPPIKK